MNRYVQNIDNFLENCNALFKIGKCIGFYTIKGKIKVKINEHQTKITSQNRDLI